LSHTNLVCEGGRAIRIPALAILISTSLLAGAALPAEVPVPLPRPDVGAPSVDTDKADKKAPAQGVADPETDALGEDTTGGRQTDEKPPVTAEAAPPIELEDAKSFAACVGELNAMGAEFSEAKRIDAGGGCGIDRPLTVKSLGGGVKLSPEGTMRCRTAVNLARWTRDVVVPMLAKSQPAEALAEVNQASGYVCRKRNNAKTGKVSEHAYGNAVDIAGFTFKSGKTFTIQPREVESTLNGAFQRAIASAACLYFSTVLDPGSDKAHETHLHLDTKIRKGGYRYCW
jgi:hypothetical protein